MKTEQGEGASFGGIQTRERKIAIGFDTGTTSARDAMEALGIPKEVSGLVIVDLAAGASSLTAHLLEKGADAYAVDRLYLDDEELKRSMDEGIARVTSRYLDLGMLDFIETTKRSREEFEGSFEKRRERYRGAWLTRLPFEDNFSDITCSLHGISNLGENFDVMWQAILEAIRITKQNGLVIIAPFSRRGSRWGEFADAHARVTERVKSEGLGLVNVTNDGAVSFGYRLQIRKT